MAAAGRPLVRVSATGPLETGVFVSDGRIVEATEGGQTEIADISGVRALRGAHNWQNAAAAVAAARALGLDRELIAAGLHRFPGLVHRMEPVGRVGKVLFVNDSKATNTEAAARALSSFEHVYWIAGGRSKQRGLDELKPHFSRVRRAFLIGEAASEFAALLDGEIPCEICGELAVAVSRAAEEAGTDAGHEPVVLLSPACTSFDQFADFEARGEAFRRLVSGLDDVVMTGGEAA